MTTYPSIQRILTIDDVGYGDRDGFVADPFVVRNEGDIDHLFFEVFYRDPREKVVGCAKRTKEMEWEYEGIAIKNDEFEYSFPYTFQYDSGWYMLPSIANTDGTQPPLILYKAVDFPLKWKVESKFDIRGVDPIVFQLDHKWYLICNEDHKTKLYFSEDLVKDNWKEHPSGPLNSESRLSRMGGRPVNVGGSLYLMYQDGYYHYGEQVRCCRVIELDEESFQQQEINESPIVSGQYNQSWNHLGMHHVDFYLPGNFVIVDGHNNDGWSIGMASYENNTIPTRLTPSPEEFDIKKSVRRSHQVTLDRINIVQKASEYRKENGMKATASKGFQKLIN